jgi:nitrite reductase/ring-hydroxylating ferredoxin subunit
MGQQIGIRHTAPPIDPPEDFVAVLDESELGSEPKTADLAGIPVLLSRDANGAIHAIAATCTHRGAALGEGTFSDGCVTCPWHAARFDLRTGTVLEGPAVFPLSRFETRVVAGKIEARRAF